MSIKRKLTLALAAAILVPLIVVTAPHSLSKLISQSPQLNLKTSGQSVDLAFGSEPAPLETQIDLPPKPLATHFLALAMGQQAPVTSAPHPEAKAIVPGTASKHASHKTSGGKSVAIGKSPVIGSYTQADLYWLARMIYAEAAAEPYNGQVAVGDVILHRVVNSNYPHSIKGVEFQVIDGHYQFTPVLNGYIYQVQPNATSYQAARDALDGKDPSHGAMLYYNPATSTNKWILSQPVTVIIGKLVFAK